MDSFFLLGLGVIWFVPALAIIALYIREKTSERFSTVQLLGLQELSAHPVTARSPQRRTVEARTVKARQDNPPVRVRQPAASYRMVGAKPGRFGSAVVEVPLLLRDSASGVMMHTCTLNMN